MAETIGGIQIEISGDQTKLNAAINSSVATAQAGGQKIASALNSATAPAANLTTALERLTKANMAFADENVRALQAVQASAPGYQEAQEKLAQLNAELRVAQQQYALAAGIQETGATTSRAAAAAWGAPSRNSRGSRTH